MDKARRNWIAREIRRYVVSQKLVDQMNRNSVEVVESDKLNTGQITLSSHKQFNAAMMIIERVEPAWNTLTDTQQYILREFYGQPSKNTGATKRVTSELGLSERQVYRLCAKALDDFNSAFDGE